MAYTATDNDESAFVVHAVGAGEGERRLSGQRDLNRGVVVKR